MSVPVPAVKNGKIQWLPEHVARVREMATEFTTDEIADAFGVKRNAVSMLMHKHGIELSAEVRAMMRQRNRERDPTYQLNAERRAAAASSIERVCLNCRKPHYAASRFTRLCAACRSAG